MKYYLGVDAGGTYTRCSLYDETGDLIVFKEFESLHFMRVGYEGMRIILSEIKQAFKDYQYEITLGIAGYGQDKTIRHHIESVVYDIFPKAQLMNDAQLAMTSALEYDDGIFVISGTGSIAFEKYQGQVSRKGGWGYLIDDEGSAFDIGKQTLKTFVDMADNRLEQTDMFHRIMSELKLEDPYQIIKYINDNSTNYRQTVASLAKVIYPCALEGDIPAIEIYTKAGNKLSALVKSFNHPGTTVSYGGSVLIHNEFVREAFTKDLEQDYTIKKPVHTPEYAAFIK